MMGNPPVAAVFAREITPGLTSLVKKLEQATADHSDCKMGAWVVVLTDDDKMEDKLKELAKKEDLKHIVLTIDTPTGPPRYKIAKDADVTVVLYQRQKVKANFAFKKGELHEPDIDKIVADVKDILPEKKDSE